MATVVVGIIGTLLGVAVGGIMQQIQATRARVWQRLLTDKLLDVHERIAKGSGVAQSEVDENDRRRKALIDPFKADLDIKIQHLAPATGSDVVRRFDRESARRVWGRRRWKLGASPYCRLAATFIRRCVNPSRISARHPIRLIA